MHPQAKDSEACEPKAREGREASDPRVPPTLSR